MLNRKEVIALTIIILIFTLAISLIRSTEVFLFTLLSFFLIILINVSAKKIMASYYDSEIEMRIWEIKRYGFSPRKRFSNPLLAGAIFPLISVVFLQGYLVWMASLVFDIKPKISRAVKRHGLYSFSEMTEGHIGLIAAAGIVANLFFALVGYLIGLPSIMNFTFLSIWFVLFNMLPLSDLDGNKIFFGSFALWVFLTVIIAISALFTIITI